MKFFDTTPTGRILNRFSKDMDEGISHFFYALEPKLQLPVLSSLLDDLPGMPVYPALEFESTGAAGVCTRNMLVLAFSLGCNLSYTKDPSDFSPAIYALI